MERIEDILGEPISSIELDLKDLFIYKDQFSEDKQFYSRKEYNYKTYVTEYKTYKIDKIQYFRLLLLFHDWYYQMSDDYMVWLQGLSESLEIKNILKNASDEERPILEKYYQMYVNEKFKGVL